MVLTLETCSHRLEWTPSTGCNRLLSTNPNQWEPVETQMDQRLDCRHWKWKWGWVGVGPGASSVAWVACGRLSNRRLVGRFAPFWYRWLRVVPVGRLSRWLQLPEPLVCMKQARKDREERAEASLRQMGPQSEQRDEVNVTWNWRAPKRSSKRILKKKESQKSFRASPIQAREHWNPLEQEEGTKGTSYRRVRGGATSSRIRAGPIASAGRRHAVGSVDIRNISGSARFATTPVAAPGAPPSSSKNPFNNSSIQGRLHCKRLFGSTQSNREWKWTLNLDEFSRNCKRRCIDKNPEGLKHLVRDLHP